MAAMKPCTKCGIDQPLSNYSPDKRVVKDGLQGQCKSCRTVAMKTYRDSNPDITHAIAAACYRRNAEVFKERSRQYDRAHREQRRASSKAWVEANGDRLRAYHREYRRLNPERVRANERNYDHRKRANTPVSDVTAERWAERVYEFGGRCAYCMAAAPLEMEHITPVSKGGSHTMDNLVPACLPCNRSKKDAPLLVFLLRRKAA